MGACAVGREVGVGLHKRNGPATDRDRTARLATG